MLTIGERVRYARTQKSIGLRELSRRTGVSASMITRIEQDGRPHVSLAIMAKLARELGVTLDYLAASLYED